MPTATTVGMLSLNNLGALTTTFSAPSSCATVPGWHATGIANPDIDSLLILPVDGCGGPIDLPEQCLPHGDKISEQWESLHTQVATILNYYSPGLHCPNDWATVGVYTAGQESNDTTATGDGDLGIFSPTAFNNGRPGQSTSFPYADFSANMFTSALEPSETAVVCCPSGFGIDPYGACYSNIPISELAGRSACYGQATGGVEAPNENGRETITWGFWGDSTTVTRLLYDYPTATDYYSTVTVSFDDDGIPETGVPLPGRLSGDYDDDELKGIVAVMPLYLVHSGEDGNGGEGNGGGNENEDDNEDGDGNDEDEGSDEEGSNEDDDSAAGHLSPTTGVFAAGFSFAAGLGLLIAW